VEGVDRDAGVADEPVGDAGDQETRAPPVGDADSQETKAPVGGAGYEDSKAPPVGDAGYEETKAQSLMANLVPPGLVFRWAAAGTAGVLVVLLFAYGLYTVRGILVLGSTRVSAQAVGAVGDGA
jgi:hypothetical protein